MNEDFIKEYSCKKDLRVYEDSLLFEHGTTIAKMKYEDNDGYIIDIELEVVGDIHLVYKGEDYYSPSEYTKELKEKIVMGDFEDVDMLENNWFEFIYTVINDEKGYNYSDGILADDLVGETTETIKSYMLEIIENLIDTEK